VEGEGGGEEQRLEREAGGLWREEDGVSLTLDGGGGNLLNSTYLTTTSSNISSGEEAGNELGGGGRVMWQ